MHLVAGVVSCVWFICTCMAHSRIKEVSFTLAGALLTFWEELDVVFYWPTCVC